VRAQTPSGNPNSDHSAAERPRRDAITPVSGASDASTAREVAIIPAAVSWYPASAKPEAKPIIVASVCIGWLSIFA